jgi:hypothetical protein
MKNGIDKKDKIQSSKPSLADLNTKILNVEFEMESTNKILELMAQELQEIHENVRILVKLFTFGQDKN